LSATKARFGPLWWTHKKKSG